MHGGRNNFILDDMFVLDLGSHEWSSAASAEAPGRRPPTRHGHIMTVHSERLYMFGGYDELGAYSSVLYSVAVPYSQVIGPNR